MSHLRRMTPLPVFRCQAANGIRHSIDVVTEVMDSDLRHNVEYFSDVLAPDGPCLPGADLNIGVLRDLGAGIDPSLSMGKFEKVQHVGCLPLGIAVDSRETREAKLDGSVAEVR